MTQKEKAQAVLNYLEEMDSEVVINILQSYISDRSLARLYDKMKAEGISVDAEDEDDDTPEEVREALEYVREQLDADELMIILSRVSYNLNHRLPAASQVNDSNVIDLLEEYGEDNDMPEGWWENEGDIDDWLIKL